VPFHFWCPDVFEGAPAEIGAFLSVASKAAALGLSARFLFALAGPEVAGQTEAAGSILAVAWALFASITTTFGNLAALAQTNLKRLLAYSTIAHAGFMMIALVPIGPRAVAPLIYYVSAYLLMNLGAFAVVAFVRNKTGSEDISAYRGLVRRSPVLAVGLAFCLLSLLGIPPLTGFAAKFQVFAVLYETGRTFGTDSPFAWLYFGLLVIAGLNTAISAGYYLRIVRTMVLDDAGDLPAIPVSLGTRVFVTLMAALIIVAGILWDPITRASRMATHSFDRSPGQVVEKKK
jgi:NADH-quinone oxidoreductase subunit N